MARQHRNYRGIRAKKITPLGDSSIHWNLAVLAYEYKLSPRELEQLSPRMLFTMGKLLEGLNRKHGKR